MATFPRLADEMNPQWSCHHLRLDPRPFSLVAASFSLALPGPGSVRAVLGISAYATGGLFHHPLWRSMALDTNCALFSYDLRKAKIDATITDVAPDSDGFTALAAGLESLAAAAGHPELTEVPLAFTGLSKSADQAVHYADLAGPRALAAVAFQMPVGLKPHEAVLGRLATVPVLAPFAECDRFFAPELMAYQLAFVHSPESRPHPWAGVFRARLSHHEPGEQSFVTDWLRAIIRARLPEEPGSPMQRLNYDAGWHGDFELAAPAEDLPEGGLRARVSIRPAIAHPSPKPHRRHWLPDEPTAIRWQTACSLADTRETVPEGGIPDDHA